MMKLNMIALTLLTFAAVPSFSKAKDSKNNIEELKIVSFSNDLGGEAVIFPQYCQGNPEFYCTAIVLRNVVTNDKTGGEIILPRVLIFTRSNDSNNEDLLGLLLSQTTRENGLEKVEMGSLKIVPVELGAISTDLTGPAFVGQFKMKVTMNTTSQLQTFEFNLGMHMNLELFKK